MARSKAGRKGRLFNLLCQSFTVSFFHKPSMTDGDDCYVMILNDTLKLEIREIGSTIIIDRITPLTIASLEKLYTKLITTLMKQTEFSALIDISGSTFPIQPTCIKMGVPVIEDEEITTTPKSLYLELKNFFKNDTSRYGLYLLSVATPREDPEEPKLDNEPEEIVAELVEPNVVEAPEDEPEEVKDVKPGDHTTTDELWNRLIKEDPTTSINMDYDGKTFKFLEMEFGVIEYLGDIYITGIRTLQDFDYMMGAKFVTILMDMRSLCKVSLIRVQSDQMNTVCRGFGFEYLNSLSIPYDVMEHTKNIPTGYGSFNVEDTRVETRVFSPK